MLDTIWFGLILSAIVQLSNLLPKFIVCLKGGAHWEWQVTPFQQQNCLKTGKYETFSARILLLSSFPTQPMYEHNSGLAWWSWPWSHTLEELCQQLSKLAWTITKSTITITITTIISKIRLLVHPGATAPPWSSSVWRHRQCAQPEVNIRRR